MTRPLSPVRPSPQKLAQLADAFRKTSTNGEKQGFNALELKQLRERLDLEASKARTSEQLRELKACMEDVLKDMPLDEQPFRGGENAIFELKRLKEAVEVGLDAKIGLAEMHERDEKVRQKIRDIDSSIFE